MQFGTESAMAHPARMMYATEKFINVILSYPQYDSIANSNSCSTLCAASLPLKSNNGRQSKLTITSFNMLGLPQGQYGILASYVAISGPGMIVRAALALSKQKVSKGPLQPLAYLTNHLKHVMN